MSEQIDIAVDLGVVAPPLPEICFMEDFVVNPPVAPPQLIEGVLHFRLHCIIDTAGKSLHGWFDAPKDRVREERLKAGLIAFGCDPKIFTHSQPVRVPGAYRDGKLQRLVWVQA